MHRIRYALGYEPIFVNGIIVSSRFSVDRFRRVIERIQQQRLTSFGHELLIQLKKLHGRFSAMNDAVPLHSTRQKNLGVPNGLGELTVDCFRLTTRCEANQPSTFKDILIKAGLTPGTWMEERSINEIEKIGSYWRIAKSLRKDFKAVVKICPGFAKLHIRTLQPFEPGKTRIFYQSSPPGRSHKPGLVECFVHAEIQLLCHYGSQARNLTHFPRVIGASKLSCFLCFLCISCYGGMKPPLPHGTLYDKWTIPDLAQYDETARRDFRQMISLMNRTIIGMSRQSFGVKNQAMTSRVHLKEAFISPMTSVNVSSNFDMQGRTGTADQHGPDSRPEATSTTELLHPEAAETEVVGASSSVVAESSNGHPVEGEPLCQISLANSDQTTVQLVGSNPEIHLRSDMSEDNRNEEPRLEIQATVRPNFGRLLTTTDPEFHFFVEVQAPSTGQARLMSEEMDFSDDQIINIGIEKLEPGKDVVLTRLEGQDDMVIVFGSPHSTHTVGIVLRWD